MSSPNFDEQLWQAAANGELEAVNEALAQGADVNARGSFNNTALNEAASQGHLEIVKRLLEAGADIENHGGADMTPLMQAAFAGEVKTVQVLLDAGALVNQDLLSSLQMKVNILNENAEAGMVRPEAAAAWTRFLEWMQLAQIRQIKPQTENYPPAEAQLLHSASDGNLEQLNQALQAGANVNGSDDQDISALRWAARGGHVAVIKALLEAGANINQQSDSGWTALMQAVVASSESAVSLLIERGADVQAKTFADMTALDFAYKTVAFASDPEAARQIIQRLQTPGSGSQPE